MTKYILDAQNKRIGRIASEAAVFLMAKNLPDFARNKVPIVTVEIKNAGKALIDEKKKAQKTYSRYSGYPGGLKQPTMAEITLKKGQRELFKEAVWGMLPKNKLRSKMILNLKVTE